MPRAAWKAASGLGIRVARAVPLAILLSLFALLLGVPASRARDKPARAAVATENALATREAFRELDAGGNAFDAIVRAALVAGVASPSSSGLGGGGFAMLWRAGSSEPFVLDFRETAPAGLDAAGFEQRPFKPEERARASGVPGELAGLWEIQQSFGRHKWRDLVAPVAQIAARGFAINPHLARTLSGAWTRVLLSDPGLSALFFPSGRAVASGASLKNPKLAQSLERIAVQGKAALYDGELGRDLIASSRPVGGALLEADLHDYKPKPRSPLHVRWEGYDVYTMPPPSAGGVMIGELLGMFSKAELQRLGHGTGAYQHVLAEAMRGALADRLRFIGDPDFVSVDVAALLEPSRLAARKRGLSSERTHALPRFEQNEHGTHHLLVMDSAGNLVSLTTTVNNAFGAKVSGAVSGIVLNDELDDFTKQQDIAPFGLAQSPNRPRALARPVSSMTPTIVVKDGRVVFALGGSGGQLIATNVTQLLLAHLVFGFSPDALVHLPRFAVPTSGATLRLEAGAPASLIDDLKWRGEVVQQIPDNTSAVQIIALTGEALTAAADPRKFGSAQTR